jgi:hypothetical protein
MKTGMGAAARIVRVAPPRTSSATQTVSTSLALASSGRQSASARAAGKPPSQQTTALSSRAAPAGAGATTKKSRREPKSALDLRSPRSSPRFGCPALLISTRGDDEKVETSRQRQRKAATAHVAEAMVRSFTDRPATRIAAHKFQYCRSTTNRRPCEISDMFNVIFRRPLEQGGSAALRWTI